MPSYPPNSLFWLYAWVSAAEEHDLAEELHAERLSAERRSWDAEQVREWRRLDG